MRKLSKIDESIWTDMQDRGSGDLIKKEDSYADTLKTPRAFFDYAKENYGPEHLIDTGLATLEMTLGANYGVTFKPANIKISFYWYDVKKMLFIFGTKDIIDDLSREYDLKPVGDHYKLTLENEELKNSIVLDVIDRMLESMSQNKYIETMIHKKDVNESIWSDMQDRGSGDKLKKEDDFNPEYIDFGPDTTVYWAQDALEIDDEIEFQFQDVENFNKNGWRLPTVEEVKQIDFQNCRRSWYRDDDGTPYNWLKLKNGTLRIKSENSLYGCHMWTKDRHERWKHDAYVYGYDNMSKFDIYPSSFPLNKHFVFLVKDKPMNESVWSDMQDRGTSDMVRKEDDVDLLDMNEFFKYIKKNYGNKLEYLDKFTETISINTKGNLWIYLHYKNRELSRIQFVLSGVSSSRKYKNDFEQLKNSFPEGLTIENENGYYYIVETSNKSVIKLIDYFLGFELYESIWSDMQDRGTGSIRKKEDELINQYDKRELFQYIQANYEGNFRIMNDTFRIVVPIVIDDSKWIIWLSIDYDQYRSIIQDILIYVNNNYEQMVTDLLKRCDNLYDVKKVKHSKNNFQNLITINDNGNSKNTLCIDIIDICIDLVEKFSIAPQERRLSKKMNESIWSDMQDRGTGDLDKKEDSTINLLDGKDMMKYIFNHYTIVNGLYQPRFYEDLNVLHAPIVNFKKDSHVSISNFLIYDYDENIIYTTCDKNSYKPLIDKIKKKFSTSPYDKSSMTIIPENGRDVNNKFFLNLIDFCIENIDPMDRLAYALLRKRVNESVWSDMQDRGNGDLVKKEDEVGNIGSLKPIDIGGSVLWADRDLEIDGEHLFKFEEVSNFIDANGWRLPTLEEVRELKEKCTFENVGDYFTGNRKLVFKRRGMIYNTSVSHGNEYPTFLDDYWGWTSEPYINTSGSKPQNIHCFVIARSGNVVNLLVTPKNFNPFDSVTTDKSAKLCVRLVRSK